MGSYPGFLVAFRADPQPGSPGDPADLGGVVGSPSRAQPGLDSGVDLGHDLGGLLVVEVRELVNDQPPSPGRNRRGLNQPENPLAGHQVPGLVDPIGGGVHRRTEGVSELLARRVVQLTLATTHVNDHWVPPSGMHQGLRRASCDPGGAGPPTRRHNHLAGARPARGVPWSRKPWGLLLGM